MGFFKNYNLCFSPLIKVYIKSKAPLSIHYALAQLE